MPLPTKLLHVPQSRPHAAPLPRFAAARALPRACSLLALIATGAMISTSCPTCARAEAQANDPALRAIREAVNAELSSSDSDHSAWMYLDHDIQPDRDTVRQVIETPKGDLSRLLILNGHKLAGSEEQMELERIHEFVNSPEEQEKKRRMGLTTAPRRGSC